MSTKVKEALTLFWVQTCLYGVMCVNTRAIAEVDYSAAIASDFAIASLNFFVIRKIARGGDETHQWFGYVLGSIAGTAIGIYSSTLITR